MRLVSASDEVIIWDSDLTQISVINPFKKSIGRAEWACSCQALCLLSDDGSSIGLSWIDKDVTTDIHTDSVPATCISLSSKSRHLLIGKENGIIHNYDMKSQSTLLTFKSNKASKVTSTVFSENDTRVIASYSDGDILTFNRSSAFAYSPCHLPSKSPSSWITKNLVSSNIISTCHSDGTLAVWDIAKLKLDHSYQEHVGPVSRAEFSPINKSLLVSCGLDNRVLFYDIDSHKVINKMDCRAAVTCLSLAQQGNILAIGKYDGAIVLYDLRKLDKHLALKQLAHTSAVREVAFEKDFDSDYLNYDDEKENSHQVEALKSQNAAFSSFQSNRAPLTETASNVFSNRDSMNLDFSVCSEDFSSTFSIEQLDNMTFFDNDNDLERKSIGPPLSRQSLAVKRLSLKPLSLNSPDQSLLNSPDGQKSTTSGKPRISFRLGDDTTTTTKTASISSEFSNNLRITPRRKQMHLNDIAEESPGESPHDSSGLTATKKVVVEDSSVRQLVQQEIQCFAKEFDKNLSSQLEKLKLELMSEFIKQQCFSENVVISKVHELMDDRAKLLEENRKLTYEIKKLKRL